MPINVTHSVILFMFVTVWAMIGQFTVLRPSRQ